MVSLTNSALDLCVLELGLLFRFVALVLVTCFPCCNRSENNVLGNGDGIGLRACGLSLFLTKLGPLFALSDAGVDGSFDDGFLDAACGLVAATVFTNAVGGYGLGSVLVLGDGLGGEGELRVVVFLRPVGAAGMC
jgi:hypothetical protein